MTSADSEKTNTQLQGEQEINDQTTTIILRDETEWKSNPIMWTVTISTIITFIIVLSEYISTNFYISSLYILLNVSTTLLIGIWTFIMLLVDYPHTKDKSRVQTLLFVVIPYIALVCFFSYFPFYYRLHLCCFLILTNLLLYIHVNNQYHSTILVCCTLPSAAIVWTLVITFLISVCMSTPIHVNRFQMLTVNKTHAFMEWDTENHEMLDHIFNPYFATPDEFLIMTEQISSISLAKEKFLLQRLPFQYGKYSTFVTNMTREDVVVTTVSAVLYVCSKSSVYVNYEWCDQFIPNQNKPRRQRVVVNKQQLSLDESKHI